MRSYLFKTILLILIGTRIAVGQSFPEHFDMKPDSIRGYICYRTNQVINIDGKGTEAIWEKAPWTDSYIDIEGSKRPKPKYTTRTKMLWDEQYLYIFAELEEPHIWANLRKHDTIIFHDNDFEVFIDPTGDTHNYFEIEINAFNTVMDLYMFKPYRVGGTAMLNWDCKGLKTAVHVNGTINNPADQDHSWTVEMAIPFSALAFYHRRSVPGDGNIWRINFSRVEWDVDIKDGFYYKQKKPENNWVWSPIGIVNMHAPEKWGFLQFSKDVAGTSGKVFNQPKYAKAEALTWEVYYRLYQYHRLHGTYTNSLKDLEFEPKDARVIIDCTNNLFDVNLLMDGVNCNINQDGKLITHHE
ncbi:carbohydrate-binding family 9-like protein [Chitinophaga caeni]|uniref:Carbohydrate-binding family 9-like protein n=1 Tax=Chitinophaga caeni TaxID=2029983 RepID=A0A291QTH2_9BACT|nr:carbohydrate-binding family 9-like protein [Chitinophaga caeni]ATL47211.1 carbohydrate-binding family 9-like protein [Chitinophaga caeni]